MPDLLSRAEYQALAREMTFPSNAHVNGRFTAARSGRTFPTARTIGVCRAGEAAAAAGSTPHQSPGARASKATARRSGARRQSTG